MINVQNCFFDLLIFITGSVYLIIFNYIIDSFSAKRLSNKCIYISIIVFSIFIFIVEFKYSIIYVIICFIFFKLNYKQNTLICIFVSLLYWLVVYISIEYISMDIVLNINYKNLVHNFDTNYMVAYIESLIIQNMLMLVIFKTLIQIKKFKNFKNKYKKISYISMCIPIILNILMMVLTFRIVAIDADISKFHMLILIITPILLLVSEVYNFYMTKKNIYSYILDYENKIMRDTVLKEHNYYKEIQIEKDKVRSLYHDMKNHMICIKKLCEDKNPEKAIEYIDSMETNISNYNKLNEDFNTGNMILDSILRVKKSLCIEKDIEFHVDMDFSKNDFIDMIDVCTIFSNLIDNSIEACDKIKDLNECKKIVLKSKYIDGFCIIFIENTKLNEIKQRKNTFLTSKKHKYMHGIGLNNVKKTVNKYYGQLIVNYDEYSFNIKIMIPYDKHTNYNSN